jgi:hypothetical protein
MSARTQIANQIVMPSSSGATVTMPTSGPGGVVSRENIGPGELTVGPALARATRKAQALDRLRAGSRA